MKLKYLFYDLWHTTDELGKEKNEIPSAIAE